MADYKHQQQDLRAAQQHLALRQQLDSVRQPQHSEAAMSPISKEARLTQAALEPQLQLRHQEALVAVQDLERQRLHQQE